MEPYVRPESEDGDGRQALSDYWLALDQIRASLKEDGAANKRSDPQR